MSFHEAHGGGRKGSIRRQSLLLMSAKRGVRYEPVESDRTRCFLDPQSRGYEGHLPVCIVRCSKPSRRLFV